MFSPVWIQIYLSVIKQLRMHFFYSFKHLLVYPADTFRCQMIFGDRWCFHGNHFDWTWCWLFVVTFPVFKFYFVLYKLVALTDWFSVMCTYLYSVFCLQLSDILVCKYTGTILWCYYIVYFHQQDHICECLHGHIHQYLKTISENYKP